MSELSPFMNDRMDSAPQSAKAIVLSAAAGLEAAGFVRPPSLSPDGYLAALADLSGAGPSVDWASDLEFLASTYATLRFGGGTTDVDSSAVVASVERVERITASLIQSGDLAALRDAWRSRFSTPVAPAKEASVAEAAVAVTSAPVVDASLWGSRATPTSQPAATRSRGPRLWRFRLNQSSEFLRRLPDASISLRSAAIAIVVAATLGSLGAYCVPAGLKTVRGAFESRPDSAPVAMSVASVVAAPAPLAPAPNVDEAPRPMFPLLYSPVHPHADLFNNVLADTLSELASLHRSIGDQERAEAIYAYVADSRPGDFVAQMEYATYLLDPETPEYRDVYRACEYAQRAYDLNSRDARTVQTLTDALFASGDVVRAVEIQQRWLDQERPSGIASHVEESPVSARSAG